MSIRETNVAILGAIALTAIIAVTVLTWHGVGAAVSYGLVAIGAVAVGAVATLALAPHDVIELTRLPPDPRPPSERDTAPHPWVGQ